ncbi:Zn(II)2Cys6 transcription factor [Aspergillus alliaceus]|uniref:Zn(II)2Cys6 transcription factor n=1 Tax=Petromyces alliaceus TaxID=209559 RepID=UPI0012A6E11C|nr:uncharacterized protein BDW43DRAFT_297141 [Aspergillus alliaceus]KAB8238227.1 hypothetical protein BDW43DRAFT_297141 [Aspergillus alliaceus]
MKVSKSCNQCRTDKRKCFPAPKSRYLQCTTRLQGCSWSVNRNPKPLLFPVDAPSPYRPVHVSSIQGAVRDKLVELYLTLIHDKPYMLFHPGDLMFCIRNGTLPKAVLYSVLALAALYITCALPGSNILRVQSIREQTKDFFQLAKVCVKMLIVDISLDNTYATILIGNLCSSDVIGIAFRMAQILHLPEPSSDDDGLLRESKLRTWWSLYMIDQWSSAGLNIPRQIQDTSQFPLPMPGLDIHSLASEEDIDSSLQSTKPGLLGYMVILARMVGHIQHLHRQLADGTLNDSGTEFSTRHLRIEQVFVALHLGYHHYATLLSFPYLGSQLTHVPDQKLFSTRCTYHAAVSSDLLRSSNETQGCEAVYVIVTHMTVTSWTALHTSLFGQENELFGTRKRLYQQ